MAGIEDGGWRRRLGGEEELPDTELKCPSRQRLAGYSGHRRFGGENRVYTVSGGKFSGARKKFYGPDIFSLAGLPRFSSCEPYRAVILSVQGRLRALLEMLLCKTQ